MINFTIVACRISSRLKWYKNYKNRLRLAKGIVKNKMSRFYGSTCRCIRNWKFSYKTRVPWHWPRWPIYYVLELLTLFPVVLVHQTLVSSISNSIEPSLKAKAELDIHWRMFITYHCLLSVFSVVFLKTKCIIILVSILHK